MRHQLWSFIRQVREKQPLIHGITNPISIWQGANGILAAGARPIMAEHPREIKEITPTAEGLVLNLGNLTQVRKKSMRRAVKAAGKNRIPFVVDLVGVAASAHRRNYAIRLLKRGTPGIIKGNYSEIQGLAEKDYHASGVDADCRVQKQEVLARAAELAKKYRTVVLASGETDIITDGKRVAYCNNGTPQLATITGTGCLLGMLCGCYLSVADGMEAAICACGTLGIAGELAETAKGSGSFSVELMNHLSVITEQEWNQHLRLEVEEVETV